MNTTNFTAAAAGLPFNSTTNATFATAMLPFNFSVFGMPFSCDKFGNSVTSKGVFLNDNPLLRPVSYFLSQLGVAVLLTALFRRLLKPLKQPRFVAEMLAGIMMSPSMLQLIGKEDLFVSTSKETNMMHVLENLGLTTFSFIIGIRTDVSVIRSAGKLPWAIGILSFILPLAFVLPFTDFIKKSNPIGGFFLYWVSVLAASSSFQVTSYLLEDLKLLNSEIGRLAMSSALVSNIGSWVFTVYNAFFTWANYLQLHKADYYKMEILRFIMVLGIVFGLRPFMFWLMRKVPEGKSIKESHFFIMIVMFLSVAFLCEYMGYNAYFGGMVLGLAVPSGPPLGSGIVQKLEMFISSVLLPAYIVDVGRYINVFEITEANFTLVEAVILLAFLGKLAGAVVPSLIGRMPFKDCFAIGLILSAQGFYDVLFFKLYLRFNLITEEFYTILTVMAVVSEAIMTPLICYLYDPSKRYLNYKRRTIQQASNENELRVLLCVYEEDQVFSLMNLLKASHPTRERPIGAFVLDLIELVGRDHPLFINHQFHQRQSSTLTRTDRIISAFNQYELRCEGSIRHQFYTTIAPYISMHDDIGTVALEKSTSLLIIPYHKSDTVSNIKGVVRNVLDKAPCSVGILIDKKIIMHWRSDSRNKSQFHVCVIFYGGPDSRESLAYGMRMVENPAIRLSVIRLIAEDEFITDMLETKLDIKMIHDLRTMSDDNQRIEYRELIVKDGVETSSVLFSLDDHYDFMLVGRRLDNDSPLVAGLTDWSYAHELGIIGDMLASSDMKNSASVLVVQQQTTVEDLAHKS
ncbi:cation/H(+) antiporter 15-like [Actinidia eriantha]|uniref:cation/H(+) antiporter 15-like n=1 Tax=Actinidia eriantha TaxID=165200 RepID=UPI0025845C94|nr:cation/H(+) antiporter 15-like [Actinidia eriantha]